MVENGGKAAGMRKRRELRTLAEVLDLLLEGDLLRASDMLMARFASVELASSTQSWNVSQHLELVPGEVSGVASEAAKFAASKEELLRQKLLTTMGTGQGQRHFGQKRAVLSERVG